MKQEETISYKLYPVYGSELGEIHVKGESGPYYKILTAQLISIDEVRYMAKHGVVRGCGQ